MDVGSAQSTAPDSSDLPTPIEEQAQAIEQYIADNGLDSTVTLVDIRPTGDAIDIYGKGTIPSGLSGYVASIGGSTTTSYKSVPFSHDELDAAEQQLMGAPGVLGVSIADNIAGLVVTPDASYNSVPLDNA